MKGEHHESKYQEKNYKKEALPEMDESKKNYSSDLQRLFHYSSFLSFASFSTEQFTTA